MSIVQRLNNRAVTLRAGKQSGFTLLELLVVVAILAAIAGTAAMALQDTDARASAAAHVAMMDELNKGIRSYRVLHKNEYPNRFDSLLQADTGIPASANVASTTVGAAVLENAAIEDVAVYPLTAGGVSLLSDIGITDLQVVYKDGAPADGPNCNDIKTVINSRANAVVAGNIFLSPAANGCGGRHTLATGSNVAIWTGGSERLIGNDLGTWTSATACTAGAPLYMAVGLGPASSLFDTTELGGMTSVPVYRHVKGDEYNRFIALFQLGTCAAAADGTVDLADQASLVAVVDGAGDTKEEELGEWDGTRNTI